MEGDDALRGRGGPVHVTRVPIAEMRPVSRAWIEAGIAAGYPFNAYTGFALPFIDLNGTSLTELSKKMGVSKQAVSKTVRELEAAGLIKQIIDQNDQRKRVVTFTDQGIDYMRKLHKSIKKAELELSNHLGADEFQRLKMTLKKSLNFYAQIR